MNFDDCTETDARGTLLCENAGQKAYVHNVYPPIQELQPRVLVVIVIFALCFIIGVCGNSSILTIIHGIVSDRKNVRGGSTASKRRESDNTILYIAALCVVDFLMAISLPPMILDSIIGFWIFGTTVCKLHHVFGSVGRIMSTFLITAMSFDRFVAVCHPYKIHLRSRKFIVSTIFTLWLIAFILLLPMLIYASSTEVLLKQHETVDPIKSTINITRIRVYKCSDMMPSYIFYWFTSTTFLLGYIVPLALITFFNGRLINKLYHHTKVMRRIPLKRITIYISLIATVCFVCWSPFWISVIYAIYVDLFEVESNPSSLITFLMYSIHVLPYIGSASNWILYGLLNTQLQAKCDNNNVQNDANADGSGSTAADNNVNMSNLNSARDGLLTSSDVRISRSTSTLKENERKQNGLSNKRNSSQFSSLIELGSAANQL